MKVGDLVKDKYGWNRIGTVVGRVGMSERYKIVWTNGEVNYMWTMGIEVVNESR